MKKYFIVIITALTVVCFSSCDKIEGPYVTFNENEEVTAEFPPLDQSSVYRKIFFEEYTAHRCLNCPTGHAKLETLQETYGDTLVAMAIHATPLAAPLLPDYTADFRTGAGNDLRELYNIDGIPAGIINRNMMSGGYNTTMWTPMLKQADRTVYAAIQLVNEFPTSEDVLKVNANVTMLADYPNPLRLAFYLVEDGVVSPQLKGQERIEDYVHNHMLRAAINGTYGVYITPDGMMQNNASYKYAKSISFAGKDWNPDNCYVIAILYDHVVKSVIQVEKLKVR